MEVLRKTASISPPGTVRVTSAASIAVDTLSPRHGMSFQGTGEPKTSDDQRLNYCLSKVGNVFLAREVARQLSANGVVSIVGCAGLFCDKLRAENGS
jgi:retinol dehydrogenase-12